MSTSNSVLDLLHGLTAADRDWVLSQLPAQAKSQLLGLTTREASAPDSGAPTLLPPVVTSIDRTDIPAALQSGDIQQLVQILREEPLWMTTALLSVRSWSRRAELQAALPALMRSQLEQSEHSACMLTPFAIEALMRLLATRLGGPSVGAPSRFETLVRRLANARSRRRLSLHL